MLLAVDVGNTQTSWGVFDDEKTLVRSGRIATSSTDTSAELLGAVSTTLPGDDAAEPPPDRAVIASVVPTLTGRWIDYCRSIGIEDITVVDSTTAGGLTILLDDPSEAGADRLANAVGVKMRFGAPAIVVDFGTATTIDVIDQNGAYRGGIISPGLQTSAAALFSHAARLSAIELTVPHNVIGSSTTTATS